MSKNQTQKTQASPVAREIALKSHEDAVFMIDGGGAVKLEKGRYGGWLLRGVGPESGRGMWCYAASEQEAPADALEKMSWAKERMVKAARSLGIEDEPKALMRTYKFRVVNISQRKAAERYTVYDVVPTGEEAEATTIILKFEVKRSNRRCYNAVCRARERLEMLLKAEFKGEGAAVDGVTVMVPYDVSRLEGAVAKLMEEAGEGAEVEEEGADEGDGEGVSEERAARGGGYVSYFIVVKLLPKDEGAIAKLEEAVRQKLKELNVTASVKVAKVN